MVLLPEQCTKLRFITSLLFYSELFYLLFFLSSLTYSSPPQSIENSRSHSSDSNSNWNTHKHSTAFNAEVWRGFLQILGAFFFFSNCLTSQLQWLNQYLSDEYTGNERNMAVVTHPAAWAPWNVRHVPLFDVSWVTATVFISSRKPLSPLLLHSLGA